MTEFEQELRELINRHNQENKSNTPDYIVAKYLVECLNAFNKAMQHREAWYNRPIIRP